MPTNNWDDSMTKTLVFSPATALPGDVDLSNVVQRAENVAVDIWDM
jgi:hypothetical protein